MNFTNSGTLRGGPANRIASRPLSEAWVTRKGCINELDGDARLFEPPKRFFDPLPFGWYPLVWDVQLWVAEPEIPKVNVKRPPQQDEPLGAIRSQFPEGSGVPRSHAQDRRDLPRRDLLRSPAVVGAH